MKVFELPCQTPIRVKLQGKDGLVPATFHRMDGSYGKCTLDGLPTTRENMLYLYGHEDVVLVDGRYELAPETNSP